MPTRRVFLAGALASASGATWAETGTTVALTAARDPDGQFALYGLSGQGDLTFRVPLPGRGHAAAAHPQFAEAVAFARRPGRFAVILDCLTGQMVQTLNAPEGRHFYGHGTFSADGQWLFTTENDFATGQGRIGVWSRDQGFKRVTELPSHGIGPHEIIRGAGGALVIANGGIRTHPQSGRTKLNLDTMRPNLIVLDEDGRLKEIAELDSTLHQNSLRHIAAGPDGSVACGFQWQGDPYDTPSVIGRYDDLGLRLDAAAETQSRAMQGYVGSIAFTEGGAIAATSPRGGRFVISQNGTATSAAQFDVCGIARTAEGTLATDGQGGVSVLDGQAIRVLRRHRLNFDNHAIAL